MAAVGSQVSVTTTATRLDTSTAAGMGRSSLMVRNMGTVTIDLGGSTITAGTGFQLRAGESLSIDIASSDPIFGIVASGTATVHVLQVGG